MPRAFSFDNADQPNRSLERWRCTAVLAALPEDRSMQRVFRLALPVVCAALLGACASNGSSRKDAPVYGGGNAGASQPVAYGQVRSIESVGIPSDQPQGAGAVVGGVIGAVVGRQFGDSNSGKNVGTVAGAVGGALIGNEIEKNARRDGGGVRIHVTLDQGGTRSFEFREAGSLRVGDRVRIEGKQLYRL
jgi:outer membrane lipoprotein SlyB